MGFGILGPGDGYAYVDPVAQSGWEFRVTPYAWAPSVNGDVIVHGQSANIDMSFWDLFDSGSSGAQLDSLAALMGYVEATCLVALDTGTKSSISQ